MDWGITAEDIHTLRETLRGLISMFSMLLAECKPGSETHKVVSGAIRRRRRILAKIEAAILEAGIEAGESSGVPPMTAPAPSRTRNVAAPT